MGPFCPKDLMVPMLLQPRDGLIATVRQSSDSGELHLNTNIFSLSEAHFFTVKPKISFIWL